MLLVAHRAPATTTGSRSTAGAGASVFEFDVQVIGGRLVVSHFAPLLGTRRWLQRDNWRLRLGAGRDVELARALATVPDGAQALLDLKPNDARQRVSLVRTIRDEIDDPGRVRVSAPWTDDLDQLRAAGFGTWRTIGTRSHLAAVFAGGPLADEAVTVRHTLLTESVVARLHDQVPMVIAWTVDAPARARLLARWGVDGITTNRIDRMIGLADEG